MKRDRLKEIFVSTVLVKLIFRWVDGFKELDYLTTHLTLNKVYEYDVNDWIDPVNKQNSMSFIWIKCDDDHRRWVPKDWLISMEDYRDDLIKKILA
jgi:hypothetical protein